jgi:hypothetical protein
MTEAEDLAAYPAVQGMPVKVRDLVPGDKVTNGSVTATFVQQAEHPIWTHLRLVIWRMPDGSWSHDALDPMQVVGEVTAMPLAARQRALREALLHRSQW